MKSIIGIFIVGLCAFLCGCDKTDTAVVEYAPEIEIQFVDNEGDVLRFDKDGKISFHDFVELDGTLDEIDEKNFLEKNPIEVLSITENGSPVEYRFDYKTGFIFRFTLLDNPKRKKEKEFIIKYKIPLIKGETVEELRLKFEENEIGYPVGWYDCQYNGKKIRLITIEEIFPDYKDPQAPILEKEEYNDRLREMIYNGDLAAVIGDIGIKLSLPVEIVP